jgi:hypothetical protein
LRLAQKATAQMTGFMRTTIAVVACCVLTLPASLIGGIVEVGYRWLLYYLGWPAEASDSAIGQVFAWFVVNGLPNLVHGVISSGIAILITARLFHSADMRIVGAGTAGLYAVLFLILVSVNGRMTEASIEAAVQLVGLWLGIAFFVHPAGDTKHKLQTGITC